MIWDEAFRIARTEKEGSRKQQKKITWIHESLNGLNKMKAMKPNKDFK